MLSKFAIAIVLIALVGYGFIEALPLILGPSLIVTSPENGETVPDGILRIAGEVKRATTFTLNGAPVPANEEGAFSTTLAFPHGTSILELMAKDRFGRTITITRSIYVPK